MANNQMAEKPLSSVMSGWWGVLIFCCALGFSGYHIVNIFLGHTSWFALIPAIVVLIIGICVISGNVTLQKNEAIVYTFMGEYKGTLRGPGFFTRPFWYGAYTDTLDLAIQTLKIEAIKVNDKSGNPILIGCDIFCWQDDTFKSTFDVSDTSDFLSSKGEVALRHVAAKYPMDGSEDEISLRSHIDQIKEELQAEITTEFKKAGYKVDGAALSALTYAPEIAAIMLQKQAAKQVVAARREIAEGAMGIIESTIEKMDEASGSLPKLSDEYKQKIITNLLVVLCSSHAAAPVMQVDAQ